MDYFQNFLVKPNIWQVAPVFIAIIFGTFTLKNYFLSKWKQERDDYISQLQKTNDINHLRQNIEYGKLSIIYSNSIKTLDSGLQYFFGNPFSWKAIDRCIFLAFFYPIALFALAWLFGAKGAIGYIRVFGELPGFGERLWRLIIAASIFATAATFSANTTFLTNSIRKIRLKISKGISKSVSKFEKSTNTIAQIITSSMTGATVLAGALIFDGGMAVLSGLIFILGIGFTGYIAVGGTVATTIIISILSSDKKTGLDIAITISFFVILPLANAIFDFISWAATRILLRQIIKPRTKQYDVLIITFHIIIDILIACICLVGLAAAMAIMLESMNIFLSWKGWSILDWRSQIKNLENTPISDPNTWTIIGILASTIAPTALHISYGIAAIMLSFHTNIEKLKSILEKGESMLQSEKIEAAQMLVELDAWRGSTRTIMFCISLIFLMTGIYWLAGMNVQKLVDIAFWAGDLI